MKLLTLAALLVSACCFGQTADWEWAYGTGTPVRNFDQRLSYQDYIFPLATCSDGTMVICGAFIDSLSFQEAKLYTQPRIVSTAPQVDIFIAKCDKDGHLLWIRNCGTEDTDVPRSITVDGANNIYLALECFGFNFTAADTMIRTKKTGVIVKFSPEAECQWVLDAGKDVIDISARGDNIFAVGKESNGFVAKVDPSGGFTWKSTFSLYAPPYYIPVHAMAVTAAEDGSCVVASGDSLLVYNAEGSVTNRWNAPGGIFCDVGANTTSICATGVFLKDVSAGPFTFEAASDTMNEHMFAAIYATDGTCKNLRTGVSQFSSGYGVAADSADGFSIAGYYFLSVRFDDEIRTSETDSFITGYVLHLNGSNRVTQLATPKGPSSFQSIATTAQNELLVSGYFSSRVTFGATKIESLAFWQDGMFAKLPRPAANVVQQTPAVLTVYPSPATRVLHVSPPVGIRSRFTVRLQDALGRTVLELPDRILSSDGSVLLDVSQLPSGMYRVSVTSDQYTFGQRITIVR